MLESYDTEKERKLQKHVSVETIALKKMRELKGLTRKEAGVLFGVSHKQIEKTENGRVHLSQARINRFIEGYGYTHSDYENICQGKVHLISNQKIPSKPKKIKNSERRSYKKIITKEVQALISLRQKAGFNQYEASRRCGYCKTAIGHIENGRIELRRPRIELIVKAYGFKMKDFESELEAEFRYGDLLKSCLILIRKLDNQKLHTVYQLLKSFNQ